MIGDKQPTSPPRMHMFSHPREDFLASLVVFLVALPLCIGIAVAVGVNPTRALMTGIVGGLVVGFFAGSPLQVSGPAAGLFVIVADLINTSMAKFMNGRDLDSLSEQARSALQAEAMQYALVVLGATVFLAGCFQIVAGRLGLGQWLRAVSPAVVKGMLAGIGALILISQFHVMLDHQATWNGNPAHGGLQYLATIPEAIWKAVTVDEGGHHLAAATGILTITLIILWQKFAPQKLRLIPAPLIAIIAATIFALSMQLSIQRLAVPENALSDVTLPSVQGLWLLLDSSIILSGLLLAAVASAETLLCATAVDQMQNGPRTDYDRELTAQGIGNMICGVLGALPMTGVIVRSSANVHAGAKTRLSTILHGTWLLLFVAMLPWVLNYIPKAALAALLVYTGWKLLDLKGFKKLWKLSRSEAAIFLATVTIIVAEDLLLGVVIGIALSAAKLLYTFTHLDVQLEVSPNRRAAHLRLKGSATFVRLPKLAAALDQVPAGAELHVEMRDLSYVDHACLDLLMSWAKQHEAAGGQLVIDWDSLHGKFMAQAMRQTVPVSENGNGNGHHKKAALEVAPLK